MPSYLLDTNILVDTLRKNPAAVEYVDSLGDWSYSVVCKMELIAGARNQKEVEALDKYLRDFTEVALSPQIGTKDQLRPEARNTERQALQEYRRASA